MTHDSITQPVSRTSVERAQDPALSEHDLVELAHSASVETRSIIAERGDTPIITLLRLARDPSEEVRASVARNQGANFSEELQFELAGDQSREVIYSLIYNPAVASSVLSKFARQLHKSYAGSARARLKARS